MKNVMFLWTRCTVVCFPSCLPTPQNSLYIYVVIDKNSSTDVVEPACQGLYKHTRNKQILFFFTFF